MNTKIMNMDAVTPQDMADAIANNRWMAKEQLDMDDMGKTLWKQYCQLCDNVAIQAWNSISNNKKFDENVFATSLKLLFNFFDCDAKATPETQGRFVLACVAIKKISSDDMKAARKALRQARAALNDPAEDSNLEQLELQVEKAKAEVARLESLPKHYYGDPVPLLQFKNEDEIHATKDCRKKIEDAMADLIAVRSLMTAEEKAVEKLALKMTRKANDKMKKQKKDAETITDTDAK